MSESDPAPSTPSLAPAAEVAETSTRVADFMASLVVFLVALPLCIGIAVACGVPVERGLITGIVGGAIGVISGAPLLVSGPAASLIVPVFALVAQYGLVALGPVVMLAGGVQILAGYFRLGQWFRAVAPAVITGMLTGIGVLIIGSQALVALDADPKATFLANVAAVPMTLYESATHTAGRSSAPFWIAVATVAIIVGWSRFRPKKLHIIPGHLVSLLSVTAAAFFLSANVRTLDISSNFFAGLGPPSLGDFSLLADVSVLGKAAVFAFVASAATLLTANAIDERQNYAKTNYDKEMRAQGVGNMVAGALGGLPMTGVIVRSSVNVDAGARTRGSTIMHGIWLLAFVSLAPQLLELIPRACLGAILVYTGIKLVDVGAMGRLWQQGRSEFVIFAITFGGVVFVDLFAGIVAGLVAAAFKIVWTFSRLEIRQEPGIVPGVVHLHLLGSATFLQLPRLARALDGMPEDKQVHVHIDRLDHIDHACLQLLSGWGRQRESAGQPGLEVAWDELTNRYKNALVGTGPTDARPSANIVNLVWAEWKRAHADDAQPAAAADRWQRWIEATDIELRAEVEDLDGVLALAVPHLAALTGATPEDIAEALHASADGHVPLGDGVSLPHASIEGIEHSRVAVITTAHPIAVGGHQADIFFVLLSPAEDPGEHLRALAHIGRMCHRSPLLLRLRQAPDVDYAATILDALGRAGSSRSSKSGELHRSLAVIGLVDEAHAHALRETLSEAFTKWALVNEKDSAMFELLRGMCPSQTPGAILLASIEVHEEALLRALVDEANKLDDAPAQLTLMREADLDARPSARGSGPQAAARAV